MSHKLEQCMAERIASGLKRKSITTCSKWAIAYRVIGGGAFAGPWKFKHHPWLIDMHDCEDELIVGQKSAQMGFTEVALNKTFFNIDVKRNNCLYILPASHPDASDFSTSRFDPALEDSPHLANLFSDVKNIGHKRAGSANLFIRGSRSRSQLKSVPAPFIVMDELDEFIQDNIAMIFERASGQLISQIFQISTPTIDNYGINKNFKDSTQDHYIFRCPCCSRHTELIFPECLVITSDEYVTKEIQNTHLICKECKGKLHHEIKHVWLAPDNARWESTHTDRVARGYHINQMYSATVEPFKLAVSYMKGKRDPAEEQEFFNSKLGLPHTVEGAQITDTMLERCTGGHKKQENMSGQVTTMGVDIGKVLHVEIGTWHANRHPFPDPVLASHYRIIQQITVNDFEQLDELMFRYQVLQAVIDAQPERRAALNFCNRFAGIANACFYSRGGSGKTILHDENEHTVKVDRTSWLDLSLGRFKNGTITIPFDTDREYKDHIKAPVRLYKKISESESIGDYINGNNPDHYAHAHNYSEIAYSMLLGLGVTKNVHGVY